MKYKKKPIEIEAVKAGNDGFEEMPDWLNEAIATGKVIPISPMGSNTGFIGFKVQTLEGIMQGNRGDYLIRGVEGELYPCKGNVFEKTYEKVESEYKEN